MFAIHEGCRASLAVKGGVPRIISQRILSMMCDAGLRSEATSKAQKMTDQSQTQHISASKLNA